MPRDTELAAPVGLETMYGLKPGEVATGVSDRKDSGTGGRALTGFTHLLSLLLVGERRRPSWQSSSTGVW